MPLAPQASGSVGLQADLEKRPVSMRTLEQAMAALARRPDPALLDTTAAALVSHGLAPLADRSRRRWGGPGPAEATPGTDWATTDARLDANLAALAAVDEALAADLRSLPAPDASTVLLVDRLGRPHVLVDGPGPAFDFVLPFLDDETLAASLDLTTLTDGAVVLLAGVPPAAVLDRLLAVVTPSGYRPPVELVEPDMTRLALWLRLQDVAAALANERLRTYGGADAWNAYAKRRVARHWGRGPSHVLRMPRSDGPPVAVESSRLAQIEEAVQARRRTLRDAWPTAASSAASWAKRFRGGNAGPLRVVGLTTRYSTVIQHAMRGLGDAFMRAGHRFDFVCEPADHEAEVDTWTAFQAPADLVVVINHLRGELADRVPPDVPFLAWSQDWGLNVWNREAGAGVGPLDVVATRGRPLLTSLYGYPVSRVIGTSNLTDPARFDATPLPEDVLAPARCDVSYVGHGAAPASHLVAEVAAAGAMPLARCLGSFLAEIERRLDTRGATTFMERLEVLLACADEAGCRPTAGGTFDNALYQAAERIYDRLFRHQALGWCAAWARANDRELRIYGRDWASHPTLATHAAGEVPYGERLRVVYQASRVNLQLNGYDALHPRLLDAVAAGGFVLTRYNPADFYNVALRDIRQAITTHELPDLATLVAHAVHDPGLADAIATAARTSGLVVATSDDADRRRNVETLRRLEVLPPSIADDAGYFDALRTMSFVADRVAGDIDGFADLTFDGEIALHEQLAKSVDDPVWRRRMIEPVRADVLAHDTYDTLVRRVLEHFCGADGS